MEEQQLLRDLNIMPTSEIIAEGLGEAYGSFVRFNDGLNKHGVQVDWRYYNDGKAWLGKALHKWTGARGAQKEMTIFWLSVWSDFFKVSLYIPEKARAGLLDLPLDDDIKEMVKESNQMGKLKFFPLIFDLHNDELFDTIYTLVEFRKTLK